MIVHRATPNHHHQTTSPNANIIWCCACIDSHDSAFVLYWQFRFTDWANYTLQMCCLHVLGYIVCTFGIVKCIRNRTCKIMILKSDSNLEFLLATAYENHFNLNGSSILVTVNISSILRNKFLRYSSYFSNKYKIYSIKAKNEQRKSIFSIKNDLKKK